MITKARRPLYSSITLLAVPVGLTLTAVPAVAGDLITDPAFDFDCDDERDGVDGDEHADVDGRFAAGAVTVLYSTTGEQVTITQATAGVSGSPEEGDNFGRSVAAYDENGDGCDDLVVSAPYEDIGGRADAGMTWIVPGSPDGLDPAAARGFHADSPDVPGSVTAEQYFGRTLATGVTADANPYLLIGADGDRSAAGAVYYLRDGVTRMLTQDSPGVSGASEPGDRFGFRISAGGDFVAISAFGEQVGDAADAGMAHVFGFGSDGDLKQLGSFHQDTTGISGTAEQGDHFGLGLSVVSYRPNPDGSVIPLLSVGAPDEDIKSAESGVDAGLTHLISLTAPGDYRQVYALDEGSPGVPGDIAGNDGFGVDTVLAVRDSGTVGTPSTTSWVVAAKEYDAPNTWNYYDAMVFGVGDDPAAEAVLVEGDDFGLPIHEYGTLNAVDASSRYLYFDTNVGVDAVYGVPWGNILDGGDEPTVVHKVTD